MSKASQRALISLTGGLGNQLFQLAFALSNFSPSEISLETKIGRPRLNRSGEVEISSFILPVEVMPKSKSRLVKIFRKSMGYKLRIGYDPRKLERIPGFTTLITSITSIISFSYFRQWRVTLAVRDLGYIDIFIPPGKVFINGYFQSYLWAETPHTYELLHKLELREYNAEVLFYKQLAEKELPLVVHIRLGDYSTQVSFGALSTSYYLDAIEKLWSTGIYSKIWLFSDEPEKALNLIPKEFSHQIRVIPEVGESAASVLQIMRYGRGYVIANSTFSWWGAFLSYTPNPNVVAPQPWFESHKVPNKLIPPNWITINPWDI